MKHADQLKDALQSVKERAETSELASSQDVIEQLMQLLQK